MTFEATTKSRDPDSIAPDTLEVRLLLGLEAGGMAHFTVRPHATGRAVVHGTVEELWYFTTGRGQMWLSDRSASTVIEVGPGTCVSIPVGTKFQVRNLEGVPLEAVGVTMPPWPGSGEATVVEGEWKASDD